MRKIFLLLARASLYIYLHIDIKKIRTDDTKFIEGTQWEKKINKNLETYNIKKVELQTLDKNRVANLIRKKINIKRIASLKIKGTTATKTNEMSKNINTDGFNILPPAYITKLPRHLAGIIFKTRSYMLKIKTNMKTTNPDLSCRWCKQYQETQEHIITECTMTPDIDIDLNKAMTNHNDTLIKEATQLTQIVNLLDKPPDTDVPIRPPDTDIPTRPPDTDIPNRPINILINNNPPDPGKLPDRNIPNRPLDIDIPNRLSDSDRCNWPQGQTHVTMEFTKQTTSCNTFSHHPSTDICLPIRYVGLFSEPF